MPSKDGEESFLEAVLRPHLCYLNGLREIFDLPGLHGLAHITGGGVSDNVRRILPEGTAARVDLGSVDILPVFRLIKEAGNVSDADMWRTFNMGVGMVAVVAPDVVDTVQARLGNDRIPIVSDWYHRRRGASRPSGGNVGVVSSAKDPKREDGDDPTQERRPAVPLWLLTIIAVVLTAGVIRLAQLLFGQ